MIRNWSRFSLRKKYLRGRLLFFRGTWESICQSKKKFHSLLIFVFFSVANCEEEMRFQASSLLFALKAIMMIFFCLTHNNIEEVKNKKECLFLFFLSHIFNSEFINSTLCLTLKYFLCDHALISPPVYWQKKYLKIFFSAKGSIVWLPTARLYVSRIIK